jgi:hypothetical protein
VAARSRPLKSLSRRELVAVAITLCLAAFVVGLALVVLSPHKPGIKGVVRCAPAVNSCGRTPGNAVVYLLFSGAAFNPFNPPSTSYPTDAQGHFEISLAPGTYWVAAEKEGGVLASEGKPPVVVKEGAMTDVTIELDLHLPQ